MNVNHAANMTAQHRQRFAAGESDVAAVEQQAHFRAGDRHQRVHIVRGFDVSAHMVVVGQRQAVALQMAAEGVQPLAVIAPLPFRAKARALAQRPRLALYRLGHFAVDHHPAAAGGQQPQMRFHGGDFFIHAALGQPAGMPTGHALQAVRRQRRRQRFRLARKFIAQFEAAVAYGRAFGQ